MTSLRALGDPGNNTFDKSLADLINMDNEEMSNWFQWHDTNEIEPVFLDRKAIMASSSYRSEPCSTNLEGAGDDVVAPDFSSPFCVLFDDAAFPLDEPNLPSKLSPSLLEGATTQSLQDVATFCIGQSSFGGTEELSLQDTATTYFSHDQPSTPSTTSSAESSYSFSFQKPLLKKRKSSMDSEVLRGSSHSRKSHNEIEKRYRTAVNESINRLRQGIPPLVPKKNDSKSREEDDGSITEKENQVSRRKDGKGAVLARALEYIKHLEATATKLCSEADALDTRLRAFEILAMNGTIFLDHGGLRLPTDMLKSE
jgi:hypothetical protein